MTNLFVITGLALLLVAGCKNQKTSSTASNTDTAVSAASTLSMTPEQLGDLGAQIKKTPNDADKLLAQHGLDEKSFVAAVRKVSENPADAKRYAAAYKSAS
jgi:hypothetical protein